MIFYKQLTSIGLLATGLALLAAGSVQAQSVHLSPSTLNQIPRGATDANPFWQHLAIDLTRNPSAGNSITINLPTGVTVADVNGDSSVTDDISLDNETAAQTGYQTASGSTPSQIALLSTTGGKVGRVHVQFPVATESAPTSANAVYGLISFSNSGEKAIPAGTLTLLYVNANQLNLANYSNLFANALGDTTTNAQGDFYPETAAPVLAVGLPDLVSDQSGSLGSAALTLAGVPFDGSSDTDDVTYSLWFSATDSLATVDTTTAVVAADGNTQLPTAFSEGDSAVVALDVSTLAVDTFFVYVTSNLTGSFPLARSRGIIVQHEPTVLSVASFAGGDPDFLDSGLLFNFDTGAEDSVANARDQVTIPFDVVDFDDSASVELFYSTAAALDTTSITTAGTAPNRTISALAGATSVDSTAALLEGVDSVLTWQIVPNDSTIVAEGDYYLYAVVLDGTTLGIGRSDTTYGVRHSPLLTLDARANATVQTGGSSPERYYAITWNSDNGKKGDEDRDDAAAIAIYYSDSDSFAVPTGATELTAAAADSTQDTHRIASGISEDADSREDNQYLWDLWTYTNPDDGGAPAAGIPYYLYAIISADSTERVVRWDDGGGMARSLQFIHDPHVRITAPAAPLLVDGRQSYEVAWDARDVDDSASIWVLLVAQSAAQVLPDETTYAGLMAATDSFWVATSSDGSLSTGAAVAEDSTTSFAVRPARLVRDDSGAANPIGDGLYETFVVIDPAAGAAPAADSPAYRAAGMVTLLGLQPDGATGLAAPTIELTPANAAATVNGDTVLLDVRPHSDGNEVDVVSAFISVDTMLVDIVDQDTTRAGTQPFAVNEALSGLTLFDTVTVGTDSVTIGKWLLDLVYYEQAGVVFSGDEALATIAMVTRSNLGAAEVQVDHHALRRSAFYRQGVEVALLPPEPAARIQILQRGTIAGQVRLQGRTDHSAEMTFSLRDRNSLVPISDSLFRATNDVNATKAGLQDSTDANGTFSMSQVPRGDYHLAVHLDRYLDGQFPAIRIDPADQLTGVDPMVLADGVAESEFLLAGDITGYIDTSDASIPDNEIDQLDIDFLVSFFGQSTSPTHAGRLADVNGDSLVWVDDLNLVAANFGTQGVAPAYKRPALSPSGRGEPSGDTHIRLVQQATPEGDVRLDVVAAALADMRAFGVRIDYDPAALTLRGQRVGAEFGSRPVASAFHHKEGTLWAGAALIGHQPGHYGEVALLSLVFVPRSADARAINLHSAELIDSAHNITRHAGRLVLQPLLPNDFALLPNYPNPFNPVTALRLHLPTAGPVELEVYDSAGQLIRTLVAAPMAAGVHTLHWDGRDERGRAVGSGTYLARVQAGTFHDARKMLLLR